MRRNSEAFTESRCLLIVKKINQEDKDPKLPGGHGDVELYCVPAELGRYEKQSSAHKIPQGIAKINRWDR